MTDPAIKQRRGICRCCKRVVRIRLDGTAAKHKPTKKLFTGSSAYWTCIGSYEKARPRG